MYAPAIPQRSQHASTCAPTRDKTPKCATTRMALVFRLEGSPSAVSNPAPSGSSQTRPVSRRHSSASANRPQKVTLRLSGRVPQEISVQPNQRVAHLAPFNSGFHSGPITMRRHPTGVLFLASPRPAGQRNIRHLLRKHTIAHRPRPQRRPVPRTQTAEPYVSQ